MKKLFIYTVVLSLFFSLAGVSDSFAKPRVKPRYKRVVVVKPVRPNVYVNKHIQLKSGYAWMDGHWKYNKRSHNYVWVKGHAKKIKRGKVWVSGRWNKVRGGYTYVRGFWA